jgi:hypothetical protein
MRTNRLQVQVTREKFIYRILNIHMCVHIVYQIIKLFFVYRVFTFSFMTPGETLIVIL